jgi:hypothetical protein
MLFLGKNDSTVCYLSAMMPVLQCLTDIKAFPPPGISTL